MLVTVVFVCNYRDNASVSFLLVDRRKLLSLAQNTTLPFGLAYAGILSYKK
jgi:hypothetical protein